MKPQKNIRDMIPINWNTKVTKIVSVQLIPHINGTLTVLFVEDNTIRNSYSISEKEWDKDENGYTIEGIHINTIQCFADCIHI